MAELMKEEFALQLDKKQLKTLFEEHDKDKDGFLNHDEFCAMLGPAKRNICVDFASVQYRQTDIALAEDSDRRGPDRQAERDAKTYVIQNASELYYVAIAAASSLCNIVRVWTPRGGDYDVGNEAHVQEPRCEGAQEGLQVEA